jgi:prephenate dehydrogenase
MTSPGAFPGGPVVVIGCGLIGSSVGLALREHDVEVHLLDASPVNVEVAAARGAGVAGPPDGNPFLVVVAVPPAVAAEVVADALRRWPTALVTDVTSVKHGLQSALADVPGVERYAGGHPMAGSERSGPMAASAQLFEGRPWAVTPTDATLPAALDAVVDLALHTGAVPLIMGAVAHDRAVAVVSHVPQVMSVLTAARLNHVPEGHLALAGPGLRDVTRIAGSDTALWQDILKANAADVRAVLELVRDDLDRVIASIGVDAPELGVVLESGRHGTTLIPGKHGTQPTRLDAVYVQVADQPGELSRLMADTGRSGVNIEDLRLDHDLGRPVGVAEIAVAPGAGDLLVEALTSRGWTAYR